jgi:hypothetical protein
MRHCRLYFELCCRCGYSVHGLKAGDLCPECGVRLSPRIKITAGWWLRIAITFCLITPAIAAICLTIISEFWSNFLSLVFSVAAFMFVVVTVPLCVMIAKHILLVHPDARGSVFTPLPLSFLAGVGNLLLWIIFVVIWIAVGLVRYALCL